MTTAWDEPGSDEQGGYVLEEVVGGTWQVTAWWPPGLRGGPHELHITPADGAEPTRVAAGISMGTLAAVPLPAMTEDHTREIWQSERYTQMWLAAVARAERPRGRADVFYALIAAEFGRLVYAGERTPVQVMSRTLNRSTDSIRNWLRTARQMGLLTRGTGRVGGHLTDTGWSVLENDAPEILGQLQQVGGV